MNGKVVETAKQSLAVHIYEELEVTWFDIEKDEIVDSRQGRHTAIFRLAPTNHTQPPSPGHPLDGLQVQVQHHEESKMTGTTAPKPEDKALQC